MAIYDNERDPNVEMWENENQPQSRNQERVLSDAMIHDIKETMFNELVDGETRYELVNVLMNTYLTNNTEDLVDTITKWIESTEDDVLLTLNMELNEDSYDNN